MSIYEFTMQNNAPYVDTDSYCRVRVKRIAITKCNLFFHYCDSKEISFDYFRDTKLRTKHIKAQVTSNYIVGIMFERQMNGVSLLFPSRIQGSFSNNGMRLLHHEMQVFCLWWAFNSPSGHFFPD